METFCKRKFDVNLWEEIPNNFYERQFLEPNYKIGNGESQIEVRKRMLDSLSEVLSNFKNKRIAIVTHSTALLDFLMNWCDINEKTGI